MVARTVSRKEMRNYKAAEDSVVTEWVKLEGRNSWEVNKVMSLKAFIKRAKEQGLDLHIGELHELCVEKGSELREGDPGRKYKGHFVFLGDRVKDAFGQAAGFEELSSSPAAM